MFQTSFQTIEHLLLSPSRPLRRTAVGLLLAGGAATIALLVGIFGPVVALALAAAIVGGTAILLDTHWGFVALTGVAFALPFASLPFSIGFKPTFLDVALVALFFVWLLKLVTAQEREFLGSSIGLLVGLFMLLALFSFLFGLTHSPPTFFTVRRFAEILLGIGLYFAVINTVRTQAELEWVARWVLLGSWLCAAVAVAFYLLPENATVWVLDRLARFDYPGGFGALRWIEDDPNGTMRAIGTAVDPNVLGGMMILAAGAMAPQLFARHPLFPRWLLFAMLATAVLALYWTYSRTALFGLAAALALPALLKYRRLIPLALAGLLLLFVLPYTQEYVARLLEGLAGQDQATQMRFGEYQDALILVSRYPIFGVGFTGVPDIDLYLGVSMLYLIIAENMGVVGLLVFLAAMIGFFVMVLRTWRYGFALEREALLLGFGGAVLGALVSGFADHYWFNMTYPHMSVLFWLYLGMAAATVLIQKNSLGLKE
ncbi:MAG: O-antigen ligase family protein [Caldilineaceae bacterium]|nr:O-antigen ligase family protein [Caldilineaceae bacterium]HRJ44032.1 O-antigen ligase family protein [Caldilineaceae bacterium]